MKQRILLLVALLAFSGLFAQKKELKIEEIRKSIMNPEQLMLLQWKNDKGDYTFTKNDAVLSGSNNHSKYDTLLLISDLNKILKARNLDTLTYLPYYSWENNETILFDMGGKIISYSYKNKNLNTLNTYPEEANNIDIENKSKKIAYTIGNNLFISDGNQKIQITTEANTGIVFGTSVHRDEWGISKGTFWSPDANKLAFYRMDQSMVTEYPIVHVAKVENRIAEVENIRYPMAGMKSHEVSIGVYDLSTKKTIYLNTGEPKDQFLTSVTWSPDQQFIYVTVLNRAQNHLKVNKYHSETGNFIKTLFEEKNDKWVEPEHGLYFYNNNSTQFLWFSKRDGYNHLYRYTSEGELLGQVTKGSFDISEIVGFSKDSKNVYFEAAHPTPIDYNVYAVNIGNGAMTKISQGSGVHRIRPNSQFTLFLDQYSNIDLPLQYQIVDGKGKINKIIKTSENPLKNYAIGETKIFTIKANDGTDLYCRIIKPAHFDSTKKYPVFYYVYGGPHLQLVRNSWLGSSDMFMQYMATKGYIVFTLDNRGTPNRGREFEQAIHRQLGSIEVQDQMKGVEYLKSLPYVDANRMGIQGWSYGGFLTISLMQKQAGIFKAAVAGGPVIDWKYYEIMYGERYMDTPDENPDGYANNNLLNSINNLNGRLLLIHGTVDPTVVWQHSLLYLKSAIDKGKLVDYFVYPEHEHNVRGTDRIHLYRKIEDYLNQNLK